MLDFRPGGWTELTGENELAVSCRAEVAAARPRRIEERCGQRRFTVLAELAAKLAAAGEAALRRADPFRNLQEIVVPMPHYVALT